MAKRVLGLEIGNSNIKILECRKKGPTLIVEKSKVMPTPEESVANGLIWDVNKIADVVGNYMKENKYKAKHVVFVLKSSEIITRDIRMEKMPQKDLEQILALQYHEYFLFDISQYQVTYKVVGEVKENNKTEQEILIAAAPNKLITPLIEVANKLKLRVQAINIASDAVSKLFIKDANLVEKPDKETEIMVIDMGANLTTVTIISDGVGVLNRDIQFGLSSIDKSIIEEFGKNIVKDINTFKKEYGGIYDQNSNEKNYSKYISSLLEPMIEHELVPDIRRFLQFYFSRSKKRAIEKIYIVGGGAYLKNIDTYMTSILDIPCVAGISINPIVVQYDSEFEKNTPYYANILGLISEF